MKTRTVDVAARIVAFLACATATVFAQDEEKPWTEPGLILQPSEKPWIQWVIGAFLAALVLALAFKNPHRSHLD